MTLTISAVVAGALPKTNPATRTVVENALLLNLLRLTDANAYYNTLRPLVSRGTALALKNETTINFDAGARLKYAMAWSARRQAILRDPTKLAKTMEDFGLSADSAVAFDRLRDCRMLGQFTTQARTAPLDFSIADAQRYCGVAVKAMEVFTRKFAIRKLRFITNSNNDSIDEIISQLTEHAIITFYTITPWLSWDHACNTLKRAVHNHGINIIKAETTQSRARLIGENHQNRIVSLDAVTDNMRRMEENPAAKAAMQMESDHLLVAESPLIYHDIVSTFTRLKKMYQRWPKKHMTVRLLSMENEPKFIEWVHQNALAADKIETTEEVMIEFGVVQFHDLVRRFVNAPAAEFDAFVDGLKNHFDKPE